MGARYRPNPRLRRELGRAPGMRAAKIVVARHVAQEVRAATPEGKTGAARRRIQIFEDGTTVGVQSTDIAAHLIEWGSIHNPPYAPFRRGVKAAGFRLADDGR